MAAGFEERMAVLRPHLFDGVPLAAAARRAGVSRRTATRWLAAYQAAGSAGLSPRERGDAGRHRVPDELRDLIEGLALRRPPPQAAQVHRTVAKIAAERGWPAPSYEIVRRIVRGLDPALQALAYHDDAYRDGFELVMRREAVHPNDVWQADHTLLDVMVLDEAGKPARPWLTVIEDDHSRAVCGYQVFLEDPSAIQTSLAFRQAIWRKADPEWSVCGIPVQLYTDHGPDLAGSHMAQVCADLKVDLIHSIPGSPGAGARSSGSSARSPPSCCPPCPGTSRRATAATRSPLRR